MQQRNGMSRVKLHFPPVAAAVLVSASRNKIKTALRLKGAFRHEQDVDSEKLPEIVYNSVSLWLQDMCMVPESCFEDWVCR